MDRHPVISAFVLFLVGILPAGPASQATAAQGASLAAASPAATGDFSGLVDFLAIDLYIAEVESGVASHKRPYVDDYRS
jgi:hypothetical protein